MMPNFLIPLLALPIPPNFPAACGYDADYRWVAISIRQHDGKLMLFDGYTLSSTGHLNTWRSFTQTHAIQKHLAAFEFGSSNADAQHMLVIDNSRNKFYIGDFHLVTAWLTHEANQHGPSFLETALSASALQRIRMCGFTQDDFRKIELAIQKATRSNTMNRTIRHRMEQERLIRWLDQL